MPPRAILKSRHAPFAAIALALTAALPALAAPPHKPIAPFPEAPEGNAQATPLEPPAPPPSTNPDSIAETGVRVITAITPDLSGNVWLGTEGGSLYRYNARATRWTRFSAPQELGDDFVTALACDQQGRVWAGTTGHGVSLFNGQSWKRYELVPGLTQPDSAAGPLGAHIFHITINPKNGDVWLCTDAGLARWSPTSDAWSYYTTATGLPSNYANSIAFDDAGGIYVALQAQGIAAASAADDYKTWTSITAESTNPELKDYHPGVPVTTTPTGEGLPTDLINDILVAHDGVIYAATTCGIAWSADKGQTWEYNRGINWDSKIQSRLGGPPAGWLPNAGAKMFEDYCTCLAEDDKGNIFIGHRDAHMQLITSKLASTNIALNTESTSVLCMTATKDGIFTGTHGAAASFYGKSIEEALPLNAPAAPPPFPASAKPPTGEMLADLLAKTPEVPKAPGSVSYLGQDWTTQGDWFGRYGRSTAKISQTSDFGIATGINISTALGPNDLKTYVAGWNPGKSEDERLLWNPLSGFRSQGTINDMGQIGSLDVDGPDLCIHINISAPGPCRVSFYIVNPDGHRTNNRFRDFFMDVKPYVADELALYAQPSTIQVRMQNFFSGSYHQFLVVGPADECFILHRNFSKNAHYSGIFIDKLAPAAPGDGNFGPMIGNTIYQPPHAPKLDNPSPGLQAALNLWHRLGDFPSPITAIAGDRTTARIAYRAAAAENAPADLLELMRWQIPIYTAQDRQIAQKTELDAWWALLKMNPQMLQGGARNIRYPDGFTPPAPTRGPAGLPPARRGTTNPPPVRPTTAPARPRPAAPTELP